MTALARNTDPATAHEAARAFQPSALHRLILAQLASAHEGLTTGELADRIGSPRDSVSPRMKDLLAARLVVDTGRTRSTPERPRKAIVWALPGTPREQALAALEAQEW